MNVEKNMKMQMCVLAICGLGLLSASYYAFSRQDFARGLPALALFIVMFVSFHAIRIRLDIAELKRHIKKNQEDELTQG
jgi:hypothetical protein